MTDPGGRLDRDSCARGFVRAAQYFANVLTAADVLAESRALVRSAFGADAVCFCQRACVGCSLPPGAQEVGRRAIDQVFESGLVALETVEGPPASAYAFFPVSVRGRIEAALVVGFEGERRLPTHVLEALLGVAGLVGATLARQRSGRELVALAEERAARAVAEVTEQRSRLLSDVTKALFASFDSDAALRALAQLLVPRLAAWCAIDLRDGERAASRRLVVHVDPADAARTVRDETGRRTPPSPRAALVMETGESTLQAEVPATGLPDWVGEREHLAAAARALAIASGVAVPVTGHGAVLGALTLLSPRAGRRLGHEDLALAEEVGRRAGTALENAYLYRQARDAIGVRDQFLAIASHELKTPITALRLVIDGSQRLAARSGNAPPAMRAKLESLARQVARLEQLVGSLLDVARIQAGRLHVAIEPVDLCEVARNVVERHELEAARAGSAVELVAGEPVTGAWDHSRIDQVVSNLLSNAIKYGAGKPVSVHAWREGPTALLAVTDRGVGIAPQDHDRIFQRFERAVAGKSIEGMGLGLWIAREIVAQFGGSIGVESQLGQGARFTVALPLEPPAAQR
jgi:signal transduction histidine kinase